ncbi:MAG TPA: sigma-70 family RNA polymerase sigma factor [Gaiellales bacterium]|jgi:RNA polymerase sigma-70 factor (ECF subfamily)
MHTTTTYLSGHEAALLEVAAAGDERAFGELVDPHRRVLHAHCYRMLGSLEDADDALQDALLRAWRGLARFQGRSSLRTWLHRIATNCCLQLIERRPRRMLPPDIELSSPGHTEGGRPLSESVWIEPYPDDPPGPADVALAPAARYEQRETLELAFVAALQHLSPRQRAVLLLREVLDFSALETADMLDTTVPAVNSALQRARRITRERVPEQSQQQTLAALGDDRARDLVDRYIDAIERGDVDAIITLLTHDAAWTMPPMQTWYRGHKDVVAFLVKSPFTVRWRHLAARANGQLAVGCYIWDEEQGCYTAGVLDVLTLRGDRIAEVTGFIDAARLFARFGLPERVAD